MTGVAYGFFECGTAKESVDAELSKIRDDLQMPRELEIALTENPDEFQPDENLEKIIEKIKAEGIRFSVRARYPDADNKSTANHLKEILFKAADSPVLYQPNDPFVCRIYYQQGEDYVWLD